MLLDQKRLYEGRDVGARLRNPDFAAAGPAAGRENAAPGSTTDGLTEPSSP